MSRIRSTQLAATFMIAALAAAPALADGIWNNNAVGTDWSDANNWVAPPTFGPGTTADLSTLNITGANNGSNVDGGATIGVLNIGDTDGDTSYNVSGGTLTLDGNGADAQINQTANSNGDTINTGFSLNSNLVVTNASTNQLTLDGGLNGNGSITINSTGGGTVRTQDGFGAGITGFYLDGSGEGRITGPANLDGDGLTYSILAGGSNKLHVEGSASGTGDVTMNNDSTSGGQLYISGASNTGNVYHTGSSSSNDQINGNVDASVVSIVQQADNSQLDIRGGTHHIDGTRYLVNDTNSGAPINLKQSTAGNGTLILRNNSSSGQGVWTGEGSLAHSGGVLSDGNGSGSTRINSNVNDSITTITQDSSTSTLQIFDKTFTVNAGGTSLVNNGGARIDMKMSTTGTGDLVLTNNSDVNDAIYLKEKLFNHTGKIINNGAGDGRVRLTNNSKLGGNITELVQDSSTSMLLVESALNSGSFVGDVTVLQGTMRINRDDLIDDNATVSIADDAFLDLTYNDIDTIYALIFDGAAQANGTYGALGSGADNQVDYITGNGWLEVVPEPASLALFGFGAALLFRRRK